MALQSLQITPITAMRARDVSRPSDEQQEAADRRPLRDEAARKADTQKSRGADPARRSGEGRRRG
ncbi:hypothetical protein Ssi03_20690 [Sphaerisporangium siamense]|uniref:Uncharacterized protein n=1 Tax=Sphaerisporangium siamense TaxID=795645 RepID=A0A7W7G8P5_9ACTN|nr:hypothetical protein [Sphaerisporangium siamense]MBB4702008.1 hypothetical protein [Sphaerisporangium siamense]GII84079.1 hypothetical protein Ssi03_20690 [Sphaerisporangium siamense]